VSYPTVVRHDPTRHFATPECYLWFRYGTEHSYTAHGMTRAEVEQLVGELQAHLDDFTACAADYHWAGYTGTCELPDGHKLPHRSGGTTWRPVDDNTQPRQEVRS
jgi:hypothetical protein